MENRESYYFFKLLNLCKRRLSYDHHTRFLNACKEEDVVAKGLRLKKKANIEVVTEDFDEEWRLVLMDASRKLQDLLVRQTGHVERRLTEDILDTKRQIKERFGESTLDNMVRKISAICEKFNQVLLERRRKKLGELLTGSALVGVEEPDVEGDWELSAIGVESGDRMVSGPSREEIENFVSTIRQGVGMGDVDDIDRGIEVEDLTPEENLAGVNPLPVDCPLLLVDLREISSDINSVLEAMHGEAEGSLRNELQDNVVRTVGETSAGSNMGVERERNELPARRFGMSTDAGLDTGNHTVVNLSKRLLTEAEISLLSKGLKFCPMPEKIDVYNLRKDIRDYIRRIRLREYFYSEDEVDGDFSDKPAFRNKSKWCPEKNREIAIEAYVDAVEKAILAYDLDKTYRRNITRDEQRALENLRGYEDIIIKQADKGSAVVVMDRDAYIEEAMRQLDDSEVYTLLDRDPTRDMMKEINTKINECYSKGNIDEKTRDYLLASEDVKPGRFYLLPKIHKQGCPGRPVISGCNTPTEKISEFVDHKVRPLVQGIESYIKDTNDFLKKLGELGRLPEGSILCTVDVVGLYPHIPHDEGVAALKEALLKFDGFNEGDWEGSLNEDVVTFTDLVLRNNNFEFNGKHYLQKLGTAIGTRMAPSYANIFMDNLERRLLRDAEVKPYIWWRYIDDIFIIWTEGERKLEEFIKYLNNAHNTIKFTSKCSVNEIEFLDVRVINKSGVLETDVFVKPTDSHQYLHYSSCHPGACKKSIPYAQAMRLRRICSKPYFFEKRAENLVEYLIERGHQRNFVEKQIGRVRRMTREEAFRSKQQTRSAKTPFVVTYHPGLPNISKILRELHPILKSSDRCKKAIKDIPLVAFRKPKSLGDYLVRAKINSRGSAENERGTCKCKSSRCEVCRYLEEKDCFVCTHNDRKYSINYSLDCNSSNVVYLITCKRCSVQYVGSTVTKFRIRFNNHKSRIRRHARLNEAQRENDDLLYKHFWSDGHSGLDDMNIQLIDRVNGEEELRDKEGQWAYKLNTLSPYGLNDNDFFFGQNRRSRRT